MYGDTKTLESHWGGKKKRKKETELKKKKKEKKKEIKPLGEKQFTEQINIIRKQGCC